MAIAQAEYLSMLTALLPQGAAWSNNPDGNLSRLLASWSDEFTRESGRVDDLLSEFIPGGAREMLPDWERVLGLPDVCCSPGASTTMTQRRARVAEKLTSIGGQSRTFFIGLAAQLGYTDTSITEFRQMTCQDPCDQEVYGPAWNFAWQLNVGDYFTIHTMTCDDSCDSPLRSWEQNELLCRINQLKPAHTIALVNWTMTQEQIDVVVAYGREDVQGGAPSLHTLLNTTLPSVNYW